MRFAVIGAGGVGGFFGAMLSSAGEDVIYDLQYGKPLEIEALAGTVVRHGAALGIPTPVNRAVYAALLPYHLHNSESIR